MTAQATRRRTQGRTPKGPFWLYRAYNKEGVLLYIGQTNAPTLRFQQHLEDKHWVAEATSWPVDLMQRYATHGEILEAEAAAIHAEAPLMNIEHNEGNPSRVDPHTMRHAQGGKPYRPDLYGHVHQAGGKRVAPINRRIVEPQPRTRSAGSSWNPVPWTVAMVLVAATILCAETIIAPPVNLLTQLAAALGAGVGLPIGAVVWWRGLPMRIRRRIINVGIGIGVLAFLAAIIMIIR